MTTKKTKKMNDLRTMTADKIQENIKDAEMRLKKMTFSHAITPIDNPMGIRILRREIAQMKTELRRKQLEA